MTVERMKRTTPRRSEIDQQFAARRERDSHKREQAAQRDGQRKSKREF